MTFYYLQEEMGLFLKNILKNKLHKNDDISSNDISITWINYKKNNSYRKGYGYGINNKIQIYPASIVKLVYAFAVYAWIEKGILDFDKEINQASFDMLFHSSNDATSFIVDILTGTTSGPSLDENNWEKWKFQRNLINEWITKLNWEELYGMNCCQKTWENGPFGREKDFYGINNENMNLMSTDGTAKILQTIMQDLDYKKDNINIKSFISRKLNKESFQDDPNNQIEGFLGEGLPIKLPFWSKAGLMSKVRHDAAWWCNNNDTSTLLIVFCNSAKFSNNKYFLPEISQAIYEFNLKNID